MAWFTSESKCVVNEFGSSGQYLRKRLQLLERPNERSRVIGSRDTDVVVPIAPFGEWVSANDLPVDELDSSLSLCLRGRRLEQHNRDVAKIRTRDEDSVSIPVVPAPERSRSG